MPRKCRSRQPGPTGHPPRAHRNRTRDRDDGGRHVVPQSIKLPPTAQKPLTPRWGLCVEQSVPSTRVSAARANQSLDPGPRRFSCDEAVMMVYGPLRAEPTVIPGSIRDGAIEGSARVRTGGLRPGRPASAYRFSRPASASIAAGRIECWLSSVEFADSFDSCVDVVSAACSAGASSEYDTFAATRRNRFSRSVIATRFRSSTPRRQLPAPHGYCPSIQGCSPSRLQSPAELDQNRPVCPPSGDISPTTKFDLKHG